MQVSGVPQVEQAFIFGVPIRRAGKPKPLVGGGLMGASTLAGCWDERLGAEEAGFWGWALEEGFFA